MLSASSSSSCKVVVTVTVMLRLSTTVSVGVYAFHCFGERVYGSVSEHRHGPRLYEKPEQSIRQGVHGVIDGGPTEREQGQTAGLRSRTRTVHPCLGL